MQAWAGVMLSCAALLIVSAIPKIRQPVATIVALRTVGLRWVGPRTIRALGAAELAAGTAAVVLGGRWADAAVAALYAGFSIFLVKALRTPAASCGCAGREDTPPSIAHLVMTIGFAAGAVAAVAAGGQTGVITLAGSASATHLALAIGFAGVATWLGWSILTFGFAVPVTSGSL
jgi:hypothetical protein